MKLIELFNAVRFETEKANVIYVRLAGFIILFAELLLPLVPFFLEVEAEVLEYFKMIEEHRLEVILLAVALIAFIKVKKETNDKRTAD